MVPLIRPPRPPVPPPEGVRPWAPFTTTEIEVTPGGTT